MTISEAIKKLEKIFEKANERGTSIEIWLSKKEFIEAKSALQEIKPLEKKIEELRMRCIWGSAYDDGD